MPDPVCAAGPTPAPITTYEPVLISARPSDHPSVPTPYGEIALECLPKFEGIAIALLNRPSSIVTGLLVASKAVLETTQCGAQVIQRNEEDVAIRRAIQQCSEMGGVRAGVTAQDLTCLVPVEVTP